MVTGEPVHQIFELGLPTFSSSESGALLTQVQSVQCTAGPCSDGPLFGKIANYDT